jgi:hypothetical protein
MKNFSLLYFLIFISALLAGYMISTQFSDQGFEAASAMGRIFTDNSANPMRSMENGQRSILLLGTSALNNAHPRLESAWLVSYFPSDTIIRLLPIFPSGKQVFSDLESALSQSFSLQESKRTFTLGQEFISVLEEHNYWWSGYIIFDEHALLRMADAMGGIDLQGSALSGEMLLAQYHAALSRPMEAYQVNMSLLRSTCRTVAQASGRDSLSQLASLYPDHLATDLDLNQLQAEWQSLYFANQDLTCRFPLQDISFQIH